LKKARQATNALVQINSTWHATAKLALPIARQVNIVAAEKMKNVFLGSGSAMANLIVRINRMKVQIAHHVIAVPEHSNVRTTIARHRRQFAMEMTIAVI
jgi:hypothetical protein